MDEVFFDLAGKQLYDFREKIFERSVMAIRLYVPVFGFTLLLSATLLFAIQPIFAKMILPLLGGSPQVWNTAMLFFQVMLLGGYAYAHGTSRFLPVRIQAALHLVLLCIFVYVLPIAIPAGAEPPSDKDPTFWQLSIMLMTVGGPFFILAGSAPMFQRWFAETSHPHADNPYFLYGASNLGSMASLLAYPFLIEPLFALSEQSQIWSYGYYGLIGITLLCAALIWKEFSKPQASQKPEAINNDNNNDNAETISWKRRGLWLLLSFIPSSMMLGVTTYLTTDIASVPLLWVLPLALYVGTFILVFSRRQFISYNNAVLVQAVLIGFVVFLQVSGYGAVKIPAILISFHLLVFFFCAYVSHRDLVNLKPEASKLTEFYLIMAAGGALGGVFNAIIAPQFLVIPLEYNISLLLCILVRFISKDGYTLRESLNSFKEKLKDKPWDLAIDGRILLPLLSLFLTSQLLEITDHVTKFVFGAILFTVVVFTMRSRWLFLLVCLPVFLLAPLGYSFKYQNFGKVVHNDRSYFSVLKVIDFPNNTRGLLHGTTLHGLQALEEEHKLKPLSYYGNNIFTNLYDDKPGPQKVAVIGLGVGTLACYQKEGRSYDFFEIDPKVAKIAENPKYFKFLKECGSPYDIYLGDGRLTIQKQPDEKYDVIVLDAFSSDNIPMHLMTIEAIEIFLSKLKPDGLMVFHISNNYLELEPVVARAAEKLEIPAFTKITQPVKIEGSKHESLIAHFVILTRNQNHAEALKEDNWRVAQTRENVKLWTDSFSNILTSLKIINKDQKVSEDQPKYKINRVKLQPRKFEK